MNIDENELNALRLDDYEMDMFLTTKKGMFEHQVDNFKAMPTATHSWGSQLRGCECGCRSKGFSEWRIENKGLYAQLIPLEEWYTKDGTEVRRMRHLHASEVALTNGLSPFFDGFKNMPPRLALAAVGQLASPFQSAWVLSNTLWDMKRAGFVIDIIESPLHILKKIACNLFHDRDMLLRSPKTELMARFEMAVDLWSRKDADEQMKGFSFNQVPRNAPHPTPNSEGQGTESVSNTVVPGQEHTNPEAHAHASGQACIRTPPVQPAEASASEVHVSDSHRSHLQRKPKDSASEEQHTPSIPQSIRNPFEQPGKSSASEVHASETHRSHLPKTDASNESPQNASGQEGIRGPHVQLAQDSASEVHAGDRLRSHLPHHAIATTNNLQQKTSGRESSRMPRGHQGVARASEVKATDSYCSHLPCQPKNRAIAKGETTAHHASVGMSVVCQNPMPKEFPGFQQEHRETTQQSIPSRTDVNQARPSNAHELLPGVQRFQGPGDASVVNKCPMKPDATAEPPSAPPTLFQAMPLPRLGCGGPSQDVGGTGIPCSHPAEGVSKPEAEPLQTMPKGSPHASYELSDQSNGQACLPEVPEKGADPANRAEDFSKVTDQLPEPSFPERRLKPSPSCMPTLKPAMSAACTGSKFLSKHVTCVGNQHTQAPKPTTAWDAATTLQPQEFQQQTFAMPGNNNEKTGQPFGPNAVPDSSSPQEKEHGPPRPPGDQDADLQTSCWKSDSPNALSPNFHAMPLPRLGCGGPTRAERRESDIAELQNSVNQPEQQVSSKHSHSNEKTAQPCGPIAVPESLSPQESEHGQPRTSGDHDADLHTPCLTSDSPNALSPNFHAMPLPRLGCGGPTHGGTSEAAMTKQQNESNQPLQTEHARLPTEGAHDQNHCVDQGSERPAGPTQESEDDFVNGMVQVAQQVESQKAAFKRGGVPGFSTGTEYNEKQTDEPSPKRIRVENDSVPEIKDETHTGKADNVPAAIGWIEDTSPKAQVEIQLIADGQPPHMVKVPWGHTAGQLLVAHAKITQQEPSDLAINSAMATQIPLTAILAPDMVVRIERIGEVRRDECKSYLKDITNSVPTLQGQAREVHLWEQKGWVAMDEMDFYMTMLANSYPGQFLPSRQVHMADDAHLTQVIFDLIFEVNKSTTHAAFAPVLSDHHWFPVAAMPYHNRIAIWTPKNQVHRIQNAIQNMVGQHPIEVFPTVFPYSFPVDCGFQTIGWMISIASLDHEFRAISDQHASQWRMFFHQNLIATGKNQSIVHTPLRLGGTKHDLEELTMLLINHGVAQSRSHECADMIMSNLGSSTIHKILQSPKPWTDLKARANLCKPPLRIVLPEELQVLIKNKMDSAKPIGRKNNKAKPVRASMGDIRLRADQIMVPNAVFKQQDGVELGQLNPNQINATSRGIIVVNYEDAKPYFGINQAMTSEGLGLWSLIIMMPVCQAIMSQFECRHFAKPLQSHCWPQQLCSNWAKNR